MRRRVTAGLLSPAVAILATGGIGAIAARRRARNPIGRMPREGTTS